MDLYFLRHGLAGKASEWQGDDADRPLTEEGKARMAREMTTIARLDLTPDLILSSPLLRALQTAEIAAHGLPAVPRVIVDKRLAPGFDTKRLAKILADQGRHASLMLVGHEPDFSQTIGALIGGGRVVCKKGGLAWVSLPDSKVMKGELLALITPRMLAGGLGSEDDEAEM